MRQGQGGLAHVQERQADIVLHGGVAGREAQRLLHDPEVLGAVAALAQGVGLAQQRQQGLRGLGQEGLLF
jgi:hypothetical protein